MKISERIWEAGKELVTSFTYFLFLNNLHKKRLSSKTKLELEIFSLFLKILVQNILFTRVS